MATTAARKATEADLLETPNDGRVYELVLLAGFGNSAHVFDDFAPGLVDYAHVYAITRRGHGASSQPAAGYDDQRLADDVLRVLDSLQIEAPVLAGHSMAGGELTTLSRQHSDRLAGLVYLDALRDPCRPLLRAHRARPRSARTRPGSDAVSGSPSPSPSCARLSRSTPTGP